MIKRLKQFLLKDIWQLDMSNLPKWKAFLFNELRVFVVAVKGFGEDKCQLRASALTFYSMLSVVPVVALMFGIAKSLGFEENFQELMQERFSSQPEVFTFIMDFANSMLKDLEGGWMAGIGGAALIWSVMKVLNNIELSFNDIWQIKTPRSWVRKFSDYLSIMFVAPLLLVLSGGVTVFINTTFNEVSEAIPILRYFSFLLNLLPFTIIWVVLTFLYMIMPNTKVRFSSALVAAIVAGTVFQTVEHIYFSLQIGVSKSNAVYGSFAALPLFLIWLQLSWLIILLGAEISFANQNISTYEFETEAEEFSYTFQQKISVLIMQLIVKRFIYGEGGYSAPDISQKIKVPIRLVRNCIYRLEQAGLLVEIKTDTKERLYQPAKDISNISINEVILAVNSAGEEGIPLDEIDVYQKISDTQQKFEAMNESSKTNTLLKDL